MIPEVELLAEAIAGELARVARGPRARANVREHERAQALARAVADVARAVADAHEADFHGWKE